MMDLTPGVLPRWRVLGPFAAAIVVLLCSCIGGYEMLSAVRAFVGGESLWSKARSVALAQIRLFADTGSQEAYARFTAALEVPLGDRQAREELNKQQPDLDRARAGFLRGGNHVDDVTKMVWLYHGFSHTVLMRDAIGAWIEGDRLIEELSGIARGLQLTLAQGGPLSPDERTALHAKLDELDARLIEVEKRFSASLGEASRGTVTGLEIAIVAFAAVMSLGVLSYAGRVLRTSERNRRQLAEANQRWALATASDGIGLFEWPIDSHGLVLDARAGALFGLQLSPDGRWVGFDELRALLHPEDLISVRDKIGQALVSGTLNKFRLRVRSADGGPRHLEVTGLVQDVVAGQTSRVLGLLRDVSDEVLRAQLVVEKAGAEKAAAARMEFLSRLSHELRTPLNAVLGFSQLLLIDKSDPLSKAATSKVQHIKSAGRHLLRLVDDVLNVTRIDSGQVQVVLEPVVLQLSLDAALRLVEAQRAGSGIVVVNKLPVEPLIVLADPQRLEQVFVNLLSNGCKYNRPGGSLTLMHRIDGGDLLLGFTDEGDGLDAHEMGHLFQPFHRLPRHTSLEGTGLGLVIVKQLLTQMGGDIEVASVRLQGSTFTVRLALGNATSLA